MDIGRKSNIVQISYRDGKIVKKLSLNLNNEHDALFYDSYQRLPLDNRNYMAALYASEQEHGVNDSTGHRVQELALTNPKEDTVIMREKRNAELESLDESIKAYDRMIKKIKDDAMGQPNATEKAEIAELEKKRDELKRKVRNINSSVTKVLNSAIFMTGHLSGISPLTKDALKESLNTVADALNKDVVAFLEDRFDKLSSKDNGESGSEQFVMTNAAYLAAMCEQLGFKDDVSPLSDAIKRFYGLLETIKRDTLTQDAYDNNYAQSVDDIIDLMDTIDKIDIPGYLNKGKTDVIVTQLKPIAASIKFALGRAAYKTYIEADKRYSPNWNTIKAILDGSNFKDFVSIGNEENTFRETKRYQRSDHPYDVFSNAIADAVEIIYDYWQEVPSVRVKTQNNESYRAFMRKINELEDAEYIGRASFVRKGNNRKSSQDAIELTTEFDLNNNTLKFTKFVAIGTKLEEDLHGIEYDNWLYIPDYDRGRYTYVYQKPTIDKDGFVSTVTNAILSQIKVTKDGELSADVMRKLVSKGSGIDRYIDDIDEAGAAQYRALDAPESKFHNIIDMGNPLKEIRSRRRRY